jgi:general secretion pathway protein A
MYLDFYKLHLKPFQISTDPRFLWLGEKHQEALAVLKYGILDNKGFLLLTGDVGTGKTTLLNALIDSLGEDVLVAMVPDPGLAKMDFFNFVADSFGMDKSFKSKGEFLIFLKNYLIDLHRQNKQALLIIDECQHLNQKLLEEVRLLSNIEMTNTKLINIFFVGQSEFNNIILRPHNRAIRQRITINYNISALSETETEAYIRFRLGVAGSDDKIFTTRAIEEVFAFSNGYPRLINIVCDQALLTGFVREKKRIDEKIVAECAGELKIPHGKSIEESDATPEARYEKPKARFEEEEKDETLQLKNMLALMRRRLPLEKPLVIALLVVLIIWVALVTTFIFNRQPSDATNSTMDTKSVSEHTPAAVVAPETPSDRGANGGEQRSSATTAQTARKGAANNEAAEPSKTSPVADEGSLEKNAAGGINGLNRAQASLASDIREDAGQRISLDDIRERYGTYPEVYFEFNGNSLDAQGYELLGMISQFCLQNPEVILILRGYTDKTGVRAYNLKLSQFRADMVKTYLVGRGVKDESITTMAIGPGEQGPGGTTVPFDGARRKVLIEIISPNG